MLLQSVTWKEVGGQKEGTKIRKNGGKMTKKSHLDAQSFYKTKTPNKQAVRQKYPGKRTKNRETVFWGAARHGTTLVISDIKDKLLTKEPSHSQPEKVQKVVAEVKAEVGCPMSTPAAPE